MAFNYRNFGNPNPDGQITRPEVERVIRNASGIKKDHPYVRDLSVHVRSIWKMRNRNRGVAMSMIETAKIARAHMQREPSVDEILTGVTR